MMASGEIRLSSTTMRQMPVLAQSQTTGGGSTVWNDPNDASAGLTVYGSKSSSTTDNVSAGASWFQLPSFSDMYSLLNYPRFYINTAKEFAGKIVVTLGARLLPASVATGLQTVLATGGLASIPLYEAATAADAETMFIQESSANLPVNLPNPSGSGVAMGGGVYWTEDYYGQN
jgi:hypothetical protein